MKIEICKDYKVVRTVAKLQTAIRHIFKHGKGYGWYDYTINTEGINDIHVFDAVEALYIVAVLKNDAKLLDFVTAECKYSPSWANLHLNCEDHETAVQLAGLYIGEPIKAYTISPNYANSYLRTGLKPTAKKVNYGYPCSTDETFINPINTDNGMSFDGVVLDLNTGELSVNETFRQNADENFYASAREMFENFCSHNGVDYMHDTNEYAMLSAEGFAIPNLNEAAYWYIWEYSYESLIERLVEYGKANLTKHAL